MNEDTNTDTDRSALILADHESALTTRVEQSLVERLSAMEDAVTIFARRAELLTACHRAALARTSGSDWVLMRDPQGIETAMLRASGADKIAELYGVVIDRIYPLDDRGIFAPEKVVRATGNAFGYRCWVDAHSRFSGRAILGLECTRWSDEDFAGRKTSDGVIVRRPDQSAIALESDLRSSTHRLAMTKAVRVLCGMSRVPVADLRAAGVDLASAAGGHGHGSSAERTATALTDDAVKQLRETLRAEILACVGGDQAEARALLKEITAGKDFAGFDSIDRMTKDWQVENAVKKLHAHPRFQGGGE